MAKIRKGIFSKKGEKVDVCTVIIKHDNMSRDMYDDFKNYNGYYDWVRSISYHEFLSRTKEHYGEIYSHVEIVIKGLSHENTESYARKVCNDLGISDAKIFLINR